MKSLLKAVALLALPILAGYLAWLGLSGSPQDTATLAQRLNQELQGYHCAELVANVGADGAVRVVGHLPRMEDLPRLRQSIEALPGVKVAEFELAVRIWPHCETLALLKPWRERNLDGRHGLAIKPDTGHPLLFTEGERIVIRLQQADFDGYLYVDYYTADGNVIHLYPNRREPDSGRQIRAGENFTVGERSAEGWEIGPPFGQELISAIAVATPLYPGERAEFEPAAAYLPQLRQLLEARRDDPALVADFLFLETAPAP
ncbi:protein of unknown function [Azotobacter beijerinckii]|uniref:DUF4384 domain-containing protein n=1 Tax=Azotobacter beijerinckii TaxID=170623 RepID=A0A1H7ASC9_9GAMM|nr:DUF4384 domain-containing protein [Azotobacter beijerinckii]SEI46634.1 protein of unknown function [Azotobacter beijerinckii]SEJ66767.1 protein of unknown function [Azotobacter beijerinckii]